MQNAECRMQNRRRSRIGPAAFTIIELLVVIGVIAVLAGLLIPMVMRSLRAADRTRTAADIQAISLALDAYHQDFGDYPRTDSTVSPGVGFAILGKALVGAYGDGLLPNTTNNDPNDPMPYDVGRNYNVGECVQAALNTFYVAIAESKGAATSDQTKWLRFEPRDGADGEGFRVRAGGAIKPAYLQSGKVKVRGSAIIDHHDKPFLYFAQSPTKINLNLPGGYYVANQSPATPRVMYNFIDNAGVAAALTVDVNPVAALKRMQLLMGDYFFTGTTGGSTTPVTTAPYILWSVGPDGYFGPLQNPDDIPANAIDRRRAAERCDDVTNFR